MAANTSGEAEGSTTTTEEIETKNENSEVESHEDGDNSSEKETMDWDDFVDDVALKDNEITLSEEDKKRLKEEAEEIKEKGNQQFRDGEFRESAVNYTLALRTCPLSFPIERSKLYSNRAASKMKLGLSKSAIEDCSLAIELNPTFVRALWRRAQLYESTDKLDESLEDCKKILEIDPSHKEALIAARKLPDLINERNEKLKTEMMYLAFCIDSVAHDG